MNQDAYQRLVERLADSGEPMMLNACDIATVLANEPTLLSDAVSGKVVAQSVIETLREGRDLTIETASCIGAAIAGALKAQAHRHVRWDVRLELMRRRFESIRNVAGSRGMH
jgi:hypothetical protein